MFEHFQESAQSWFAQRRQYREENRRRVIEREGLRTDKHTGDIKGKDLEEAAGDWFAPEFDMGGGAELAKELKDLDRDAQLLARSERVRHVEIDDILSRTYTPEMPDECLTDDEVFDKWAQEHLARGGRE